MGKNKLIKQLKKAEGHIVLIKTDEAIGFGIDIQGDDARLCFNGMFEAYPELINHVLKSMADVCSRNPEIAEMVTKEQEEHMLLNIETVADA